MPRHRLGSQVLLNLFNAKPFFEECAYVQWEQQKTARACVPRRMQKLELVA